jgi:integrase/recombinase XerD
MTIDRDPLIESFAQDCSIRGMSHGAILTYKSVLSIYLKYLETQNKTILEAGKDELRGYIEYIKNERKVVYATLESHFSAIGSLYDYLLYENKITTNPVQMVRKRYLKRYKNNGENDSQTRKIVSVEDMAKLVNSTMNPKDRAVIILLAKTGMRRGELVSLDLDDVNQETWTITLKPTAKRTNRVLFYDEEASNVLKHWLKRRECYAKPGNKFLFVTQSGSRLNKNGVYDLVTNNATRVGLHKPEALRLEDRFTPHCCRHWFTTHLRRAGMPREHIQELRGDTRGAAMDIYYHIDPEDLRKSYLACIPKLGLE